MKLRLEARVISDSPDAVGRMLVTKLSAASVARDGSDWIVRAEVDSASARRDPRVAQRASAGRAEDQAPRRMDGRRFGRAILRLRF
jgi:hypothetical protein